MNCQEEHVEVLERIHDALREAERAIAPFVPGSTKVEFKSGDDPVTEADRVANGVLLRLLKRDGEGWLSEESADDRTRLQHQRVWVVDPLDGTREFTAGIPEWCISVGLVKEGRPVAGGILNPATGELFLGCVGGGVTYNGSSANCSPKESLSGATVLASRSEMKRGEWQHLLAGEFSVKAVGSIAYKLALVAAGNADATWTLCPKHEWDVAAGVALIEAAGGCAATLDNRALGFNAEVPLLPPLFAAGTTLAARIPLLFEQNGALAGC